MSEGLKSVSRARTKRRSFRGRPAQWWALKSEAIMRDFWLPDNVVVGSTALCCVTEGKQVFTFVESIRDNSRTNSCSQCLSPILINKYRGKEVSLAPAKLDSLCVLLGDTISRRVGCARSSFSRLPIRANVNAS